MENLEECALKSSAKISNVITKPNDAKEECTSCNGYDKACPDYTIIKEDCYGL